MSLHANIQYEENIAALIDFMEKCRHQQSRKCPPSDIINDFILKYSIIKFQDTYIHQIFSTMGTNANLSMNKEKCAIILILLHLIYF